MTKQLLKLEEFNQHANQLHYIAKRKLDGIGIACPKCGAELYNRSPDIIFTSHPPHTSIECKKCGMLGYRTCL